MPSRNIQLYNPLKALKLKRLLLPFILPLLLLPQLSMAAAPLQSNFIMGLDIQGQRLNLYDGCPEGYVSCDDMLLVAPDLARMAFAAPAEKGLNISPYTIKLYPARTKHSLCKDGVTSCGFQGYSFDGEDINGFINTASHEIWITSNWTDDSQTLPYQESSTYLPLVSRAGLIDSLYDKANKALNINYQGTRKEVKRIYGQDNADALKDEQLNWIIERSKDCGADDKHLPRTQAEKVCFIQKNNSRMEAYFLWID